MAIPVLSATFFKPLFKFRRKDKVIFINWGQHVGNLSSAPDYHLLSTIGERKHGCLLLPKLS